MKLNHDCVRETLLVIEQDFSLNDTVRLSEFEKVPELTKYSSDELLYCLSKLHEADFIHAQEIRMTEGLQDIYVQELTWEGHAFLDNVRDPKVWKQIKEKTSFLKSVSIPILSEFGVDIVKNFLRLE